MTVIEKIDGAGYWNRTNDERLETFSFTIKLIPQIWSGLYDLHIPSELDTQTVLQRPHM